MPALALSESSSAILLQSLVPVTPGIVGSLFPEEFLLVRSVTDRATRQILRKVNNAGKCYARYDYDFQLFHDVEALELSRYGLANFHPGVALTPSVLTFLNGIDTFGASGGVFIYESPQRTRSDGGLPGLRFTIARENCTLTAPTAPPDVATVTSISYPPTVAPALARYDLIYGVSTIWFRTLNVVGPVTGITYFDNVKRWETLPAATAAPSTLGAFLSTVDARPETTGENVISEVFTTTAPGGTALRAGAGVIPALLLAGGAIPGSSGYNFYWGGDGPEGFIAQSAVSSATTAADFILDVQAPGDATGYIGDYEVVEVYSIAAAAWLAV